MLGGPDDDRWVWQPAQRDQRPQVGWAIRRATACDEGLSLLRCAALPGAAFEQLMPPAAASDAAPHPTPACSTFPELRSFRLGRLRGWRRVFAHQVTAVLEGCAPRRRASRELSWLQRGFRARRLVDACLPACLRLAPSPLPPLPLPQCDIFFARGIARPETREASCCTTLQCPAGS